jgi:hypothetical protein
MALGRPISLEQAIGFANRPDGLSFREIAPALR